MTTCVIPVSDYDLAVDFYTKKINFKSIDNDTYVFEEGYNKLKLIFYTITEEVLDNYPYLDIQSPRFPSFQISLEKNFLTFIDQLVRVDIKVLEFLYFPGGYYSVIQDPFFNTFQVVCENFEDENAHSIKPEKWSFYKRL